MPRRLLFALPALLAVAACGSPASSPSGSAHPGSPSPSASAPNATSDCVSDADARQVWTQIDTRLNAIVLDPAHAGVTDVATGAALAEIRQYIADTLVSKHLVEREVDTLDSLSVDSAGCNGAPLTVSIRTTVTRDDYLKPDGSVDHSDPAVGTQLHLQESFTRVGGVWKESLVVDLDAPTPSTQVV